MLVLEGGRVVTPDGVLDPGWIRLAGDVIDAVGPGRVLEQPTVDLRGRWLLPGFIDVHVHGGGGASFTEGTSDQARQAVAFHRGQGSTTVLASLVTAPLAELEARAGLLAGLADDGLIAGLHLEGPFLSPVRRGAQDPRHMIAPDVAVFERLHAAARGHLRVITLAPELPGALAVILLIPVIGVMMSRVQTRYLMTAGFLVLGGSLLYSRNIAPDIDLFELLIGDLDAGLVGFRVDLGMHLEAS